MTDEATRQVEPETQSSLTLRSDQREAITTAMTSAGDFSKVPAQPYLTADSGDFGFPITTEMETKLRAAYDNPDSTLVARDQVSLLQQINTLEALRRAEATRRQGRREMLLHWVFELGQAAKHDDACLLVFTGMNKVTPGSAIT